MFLGEVVNGRGAVGVPMGEKAAEWRRGTKTSERLRPYAAAESLGCTVIIKEQCPKNEK